MNKDISDTGQVQFMYRMMDAGVWWAELWNGQDIGSDGCLLKGRALWDWTHDPWPFAELYWPLTPGVEWASAPLWDPLQGSCGSGQLRTSLEYIDSHNEWRYHRQLPEWRWNWQPPLSKAVIKEAVEKCYLSTPEYSNLSVTSILLNSPLGLSCHFWHACLQRWFALEFFVQ